MKKIANSIRLMMYNVYLIIEWVILGIFQKRKKWSQKKKD